MLSRAALIAFGLALSTSILMSAEADIGGVSVQLPPPAGFCELTDRQPGDRRMIEYTAQNVARGGNKLLAMSAECGQLADWRSGARKLLDDYSQYQTFVDAMNERVSPTEIQEICRGMREQGEKLVSASDLKKRLEETPSRLKVNEISYQGILAEEHNACYAAMLLRMSNDVVTGKLQAIVYVTTSVNDRLIFLYRFTPHLGLVSITNALVGLKTDLAALFAANRGRAR